MEIWWKNCSVFVSEEGELPSSLGLHKNYAIGRTNIESVTKFAVFFFLFVYL